MIGQYSAEEFNAKYDAAPQYGRGAKDINLSEGLAWILISKTTNYYRRESDGSWTNYDCRTEM